MSAQWYSVLLKDPKRTITCWTAINHSLCHDLRLTVLTEFNPFYSGTQDRPLKCLFRIDLKDFHVRSQLRLDGSRNLLAVRIRNFGIA